MLFLLAFIIFWSLVILWFFKQSHLFLYFLTVLHQSWIQSHQRPVKISNISVMRILFSCQNCMKTSKPVTINLCPDWINMYVHIDSWTSPIIPCSHDTLSHWPIVLGVRDSATEFILLMNLEYVTVTHDWYKDMKRLRGDKLTLWYEWTQVSLKNLVKFGNSMVYTVVPRISSLQ